MNIMEGWLCTGLSRVEMKVDSSALYQVNIHTYVYTYSSSVWYFSAAVLLYEVMRS